MGYHHPAQHRAAMELVLPGHLENTNHWWLIQLTISYIKASVTGSEVRAEQHRQQPRDGPRVGWVVSGSGTWRGAKTVPAPNCCSAPQNDSGFSEKNFFKQLKIDFQPHPV